MPIFSHDFILNLKCEARTELELRRFRESGSLESPLLEKVTSVRIGVTLFTGVNSLTSRNLYYNPETYDKNLASLVNW